MKKLITLQRHILEEKALANGQRLELARLFWDFMIAVKKIHNKVTKAGLVDILGENGEVNVHGEAVQRLDEYAHQTVVKAMNHGGHLCAMASEEAEDIIPIPDDLEKGKYVLVFDPLDGSSNIDANVSVGTIFSLYRRKSQGGQGEVEDVVRAGAEQVCAGYVVYGASTMLVYTVGAGVHGFTFDPTMGEFYLSHPDMKTPVSGEIYSVNEGYSEKFDEGTKKFLADVKKREYSLRYIGSLVADFHRNLLYGGVFLYPGVPKPKLRLVYEAFPLAWVVEQAGGAASTGKKRILDLTAKELHERVPLVIGSRDDVGHYEAYVQ